MLKSFKNNLPVFLIIALVAGFLFLQPSSVQAVCAELPAGVNIMSFTVNSVSGTPVGTTSFTLQYNPGCTAAAWADADWTVTVAGRDFRGFTARCPQGTSGCTAIQTINSTIDISGLANGTYTASVYVINGYGNTDTATADFTINTSCPGGQTLHTQIRGGRLGCASTGEYCKAGVDQTAILVCCPTGQSVFWDTGTEDVAMCSGGLQCLIGGGVISGTCIPPPCTTNSFTCAADRTLAWSTSNCSAVSVKNPSNTTISTFPTGSTVVSVGGVYALNADSNTSYATCPAPAPILKAVWNETNTTTISKTVSAGGSINLPFTFSNIGQPGSKIYVDCAKGSVDSNIGINGVTTPICPHVELTVPIP